MSRILDHLLTARTQQFVGRDEEQALFAKAVQSAELPFFVLHISGPGGVGKTALLNAFSGFCDQNEINSVYLDARNLEPTPPGFADGLRSALDLSSSDDPFQFLSDAQSLRRRVLFLDTYETLNPLDGWIREVFLPQLSDTTLVVIAGRPRLSTAWRSDSAWKTLLQTISLRNLSSDEGRAYLSTRLVPAEQQAAILGFTHGYPLALSVVADLFTQRRLGLSSARRRETSRTTGGHETLSSSLRALYAEVTPDVIEALLERFIADVPSPQHRTALEICALVRVTNETLLTEVTSFLGTGDAISSPNGRVPDRKTHVDTPGSEYHSPPALFQWLRGLSFIEKTNEGLFPHDIVRDVLMTDLRWRNKKRYAELHRCAREYYAKHLPQAMGPEQQRLLYDCIFLHRDNAIIRAAFTWQESSGSVFPDHLHATDHPALVAMVARHEGVEEARIAEEWLNRQPDATVVFRDRNQAGMLPGQIPNPVGFLMMLALEHADTPARGSDPAIDAAYHYLRESATPLRPREEVRYLRFWMAGDTYQDVSPLQSLVIVQAFRHFLTSGVRVAFTFFACRNPEFWKPVLRYVDIERLESADFAVTPDANSDTSNSDTPDGSIRKYGVFGHDWRMLPTTEWLERLAVKAMEGMDGGASRAAPIRGPSLLVLNEADFALAVRDALRHYTDPPGLLDNPLLQSRVVVELSGADADTQMRIALLRGLIQKGTEDLKLSSKLAHSYGAVYHTYLSPGLTQEQVADHLDLSPSTYRRRLIAGIHALQQHLWMKETLV